MKFKEGSVCFCLILGLFLFYYGNKKTVTTKEIVKVDENERNKATLISSDSKHRKILLLAYSRYASFTMKWAKDRFGKTTEANKLQFHLFFLWQIWILFHWWSSLCWSQSCLFFWAFLQPQGWRPAYKGCVEEGPFTVPPCGAVHTGNIQLFIFNSTPTSSGYTTFSNYSEGWPVLC